MPKLENERFVLLVQTKEVISWAISLFTSLQGSEEKFLVIFIIREKLCEQLCEIKWKIGCKWVQWVLFFGKL